MSSAQVASLYASFTLENSSFISKTNESASVAERASRRVQQEYERLAKSADRLLSAVDPVHAAQSRYNKAMDEGQRLFKLGVINSEQLAKVEQFHKQAIERTAVAMNQLNGVSAAAQQRMRLLGYNISDVGTQLLGGQNPFMILAQQGPQLAMAFDGAKGAVGRFASFLTGPWGAAILAATSVAGMLWMKLMEGKEASEKSAGATKTLSQAIEELDRVSGLSNKTLGEQIRLSREAAKVKADEAKKTIGLAKAEIDRARAAMATGDVQSPYALIAKQGERGAWERYIKEREKAIADLEKEVSNYEASVRGSTAALIMQQITEKMDAAAAATGRYERASEALRKEFVASKMSQEEYARREEALRRTRDAELEAANATEKASKAQDKAAKEWEKASNSRIATLLSERTALQQYTKDLGILDEALKKGSITGAEFDLAGRRAREAMLDGIGAEKISAEITKAVNSKAIKAALPKVNLDEIASGASVAPVIESTRRLAEEMKRADQMALQLGSTMSSSFEEALFSGQSLKNVFTGLIEDLGKMAIRFAVLEPLARKFAEAMSGSNSAGGGGGGWANIITSIGSIFGGARANGGPVTGGRTYLVGERGPELFTPGSSGNIIPNGALAGMAGGGRVINITVNAQDAVLTSTVKGWVQEAVVAGAAGGSALAQRDMARQARRQLL